MPADKMISTYYTREAAAQQARLDKAMRADLSPSSDDTLRIEFAGHEPTSWQWFCAWLADMASAGKLVLACVLFVAVVALAAWFVSSAIDAVSPYWPVAVAALGV